MHDTAVASPHRFSDIGKVLSKRGVGYLLAWVLAGELLEGTPEQQLAAHKTMRKAFSDGEACDYEQRCLARKKGMKVPQLNRLFAWEIEAVGEPGPITEPRHMS
jgi:hypothetical protein